MKKLLASMVAVTLALAVGCENKSPQGGPGANPPKASAIPLTISPSAATASDGVCHRGRGQ